MNFSLSTVRKRYSYAWILLKELVKTDFKLKYEGSVLGVIWSALKPLMLFAVMYVVFVHFLKFGEGIPHFPVMLLLGIVFWQFFAESTAMGMQSIVSRVDILRKINIPKYTIVVSTAASALINLGINLVVLVIFALINGVQLNWWILLLIPLIIELFALSLAVSFILCCLFVKFRDLGHIWDIVLQAGYFLTPIIYPITMISDASPVMAKMLMLVNPMAQIIQDARWAMIEQTQDTVWSFVGELPLVLIPLVIVAVVVCISIVVFKRASKYFTEQA